MNRQREESLYFWNSTHNGNGKAIDPASGSVGKTQQSYGSNRLDDIVLPAGSFNGTRTGYVPYGRFVKAKNGYKPRLQQEKFGNYTKFDFPGPERIVGEGINWLPFDQFCGDPEDTEDPEDPEDPDNPDRPNDPDDPDDPDRPKGPDDPHERGGDLFESGARKNPGHGGQICPGPAGTRIYGRLKRWAAL